MKDKAAEKRVARARAEFAKLTEAEQAVLFREFARCACATMVKTAMENPAIGVGAFIGGIAGAIFSSKPTATLNAKPVLALQVHTCSACVLGVHKPGPCCACKHFCHAVQP